LEQVCSTGEIGPEGVGLVTPYKGQVNYIKRLIRERPNLSKFKVGLEVESVDGFQGQEKEVIIFSAVRNNAEGKIGFLSDWRRLNVMLTRARRGCIVIGSRRTLINDPLWRQWLLWASARGAVCGEAAKGTWVPRYLVDDRDGMWTVKEALHTDISKIAALNVGGGAAATPAAKKVEEKVVEDVDDWEDLCDSPAPSPTAASKAAPADLGLGSDPSEPLPPVSPMRGMLAKPVKETLTEEDEIRTKRTLPVKLSSLVEDRGGDEMIARQRSNGAVDDDGDTVRCQGTPTHCPKSPARQQALANLGLIDDLDLNEEGEEAVVDGDAVDAAFDNAARPEAPPEPTVPRNLSAAAEVAPAPSDDAEDDEDDDGEESEEEEDGEPDEEQPNSPAVPGNAAAQES